MSGDGPAAKEGRYVRSSDARLKEVGDVLALYVKDRRALHVLNPTATLLFHCLETPSTLDELTAVVSRLTDASAETVESDLRQVIPELLELGLIRQLT